jgi:hypothetical protein
MGGLQLGGGVLGVLNDEAARFMKDPKMQTQFWLHVAALGNPSMQEQRESFERGMHAVPSFTEMVGKASNLLFGTEGGSEYLQQGIPEKVMNYSLERLDNFNRAVANHFSEKPDVINTSIYTIMNAAEMALMLKAHQAAKMKLDAMAENKEAARRTDLGYDDANAKAAADLEKLDSKTPTQAISTKSTDPEQLNLDLNNNTDWNQPGRQVEMNLEEPVPVPRFQQQLMVEVDQEAYRAAQIQDAANKAAAAARADKVNEEYQKIVNERKDQPTAFEGLPWRDFNPPIQWREEAERRVQAQEEAERGAKEFFDRKQSEMNLTGGKDAEDLARERRAENRNVTAGLQLEGENVQHELPLQYDWINRLTSGDPTIIMASEAFQKIQTKEAADRARAFEVTQKSSVPNRIAQTVLPDERTGQQFLSEELNKEKVEPDLNYAGSELAGKATYALGQQEHRFNIHPLTKWLADKLDLADRKLRTRIESLKYGSDFISKDFGLGKGKGISNMREVATRHMPSGMFSKYETLTAEKQSIVAKMLFDGDKKGKEWTPAQLEEANVHPDVAEAYTAIRKGFNTIAADINKRLMAEGKAPVAQITGYIPHTWHGDFRIHFYKTDVEGKLTDRVHTHAFNTKWGRDSAYNQLEKLMPPELAGTKMMKETIPPSYWYSKEDPFTTTGIANDEFLRYLGRNSEAGRAVQDAIQRSTSTQSFSKRMLGRNEQEVGGWEGSSGDFSSKKDLAKFNKVLHDYVDRSQNYMVSKDLMKDIQQVLTDQKVLEQWPSARQVALEDYSFFNKSPKGLDPFLQSLAHDYLGINKDAFFKAGAATSSFMVRNALLFMRVPFIAAQILQGHVIPARLTELKARGFSGNATEAFLKGSRDLHVGLDPETVKALQYASKNHYLATQVTELLGNHQHPTTGIGKAWEVIKGEKVAALADSYSRTHAFLSFYHFFKDSGMPFEQAVKAASKETSFNMIDYSRWKKSPVFNKMGRVGDPISLLSTFTINELGHVHRYLKDAGEGVLKLNPKLLIPIMTFMAFKWALAGMQGLPGTQDVDAIIRGTRRALGIAPEELPTVSEKLNSAMSDEKFGGKAQNMVMNGIPSSTFNMALQHSIGSNPVTSTVGVMPGITNVISAIEDIGGLTSKYIGHQLGHDTAPTKEDVAAATKHVVPTSLQPMTENLITKGTPFVKPGLDTNLKSGRGTYERDPWDAFVRNYVPGVKSLNEDVARQAMYNSKVREHDTGTIIKDLEDKVVKGVAGGNFSPQDAQNMVTRLAKLGGQAAVDSLKARVEKEAALEKLPYDKQLILKTITNPRLNSILQQYRKETPRE